MRNSSRAVQPLLIPATSTGSATDNKRLASSESYRWEPGKPPVGPISMIISGDDKRIIVLCDSVEIGRARVTLKDPETPLCTHAFVVPQRKDRTPAPGWIGLGITGHMDNTNRPPDRDVTKRIHLPAAFQHELTPVLAAGSALMVTDEPVQESTTGMHLAVLRSALETAPKM